MRPTIFISRDETRSKEFIDLVKPIVGNITCESLIDFSLIDGGDLPREGWLFFYSQTGVDFFLKQYDVAQVEANGLKIGTFGPKTGQYSKDRGLRVDFLGTGEAQSTFELFSLDHNPSKVCFIKGSTSKDSLSPLLTDSTEVSAIEVYRNDGKKAIDLPTSDILVFTSPLNLETYYSHYPINEDQKVVVIGSTTAMSALDIGLDEVHISSEPSLESLAAKVVKLCDTWSPTI